MPAEAESTTPATAATPGSAARPTTDAAATAEAATAEQQREQRIQGALKRYRVIAYIVGVGLLALTVATILDWGFGMPGAAAIIGPLHGFLYMIYLALGIDLALKSRWSVIGTVLVLIAGTIPFLSFVAERQVTKRVAAGRKL
jgi:integral membrane protein